jgi:hypothetical protein
MLGGSYRTSWREGRRRGRIERVDRPIPDKVHAARQIVNPGAKPFLKRYVVHRPGAHRVASVNLQVGPRAVSKWTRRSTAD